MHTPVLLQPTIEALKISPGKKYIDATAGEGGHLQEILKRGGEVLAIDWDENQIENLKSKIAHQHVRYAVGNYSDIKEIAEANHFTNVDGILFDYGLSMQQLAHSGKGLSYKNYEEPLDMRIGSTEEVTAEEILNTYSEKELYELLAKYSEEVHSEEISRAIVRARVVQRLKTVLDLLNVLDGVLLQMPEGHRPPQQKFYAQIFQALRIVVNHEFDNIRKGLQGAVDIINADGRVVVITFHSLEDRIVKQFAIKNNLKSQKLKIDYRTLKGNFERSATVRIISKI